MVCLSNQIVLLGIHIHKLDRVSDRYHYVRSYDRNIAVNVWWAPLVEFNATDCHHSITEGLPTIDKYEFQVLKKNKSDDDDDKPAHDMRWLLAFVYRVFVFNCVIPVHVLK